MLPAVFSYSGIKAAVHAVQSAFESDENEAVLLADASNAFNSLNRQVALHNIQRICPSLATILINTYRAPTELFVDGDTILSQEGTTQGDRHAHVCPSDNPPDQEVRNEPQTGVVCRRHCSSGEDHGPASLVGKNIYHRPNFGYFPNASKTWLTLSGRQILLNISRVDGGWVWPVQSHEWKVEFFVPQATNSIWRREMRTMVTPMRLLSVGVAKFVRKWFLDRRGPGFDDCVHHRSITKSVQKRSRLK